MLYLNKLDWDAIVDSLSRNILGETSIQTTAKPSLSQIFLSRISETPEFVETSFLEQGFVMVTTTPYVVYYRPDNKDHVISLYKKVKEEYKGNERNIE